MWEEWVEAALGRLAERRVIRDAKAIYLPVGVSEIDAAAENFADGPRPEDRSAVEVEMDDPTCQTLTSEDTLPGLLSSFVPFF